MFSSDLLRSYAKVAFVIRAYRLFSGVKNVRSKESFDNRARKRLTVAGSTAETRARRASRRCSRNFRTGRFRPLFAFKTRLRVNLLRRRRFVTRTYQRLDSQMCARIVARLVQPPL